MSDMLDFLAHRTYRHLFADQVIALNGTGLATVALALLAFELAGENAGMVLGTALAIKMIAYVGVALFAAAFAERLPRRAMLGVNAPVELAACRGRSTHGGGRCYARALRSRSKCLQRFGADCCPQLL